VFSDLVTLTFDISTSKLGHGSPVSWVYFLSIFSLLRPSNLDLGVRHGTDRQTDRQTDINALYSLYMAAGHYNSVCMTL